MFLFATFQEQQIPGNKPCKPTRPQHSSFASSDTVSNSRQDYLNESHDAIFKFPFAFCLNHKSPTDFYNSFTSPEYETSSNLQLDNITKW